MMNPLRKPAILVSTFLLIVLVLDSSSRLITSQEVEDEREFDYTAGSSKGPERWGDLKPEWATCRNGTLQSPISLINSKVEVVPELGTLEKRYKPANATLKNRGHDISLQWVSGTAGSITVGGIDYALEQLHWHSPSEHAVNGQRFALEMHMVHRNVKLNKIAVVGVLYRFGGGPNPFLFELKKDIRQIADTNKTVNLGVVDPRQINMGGKKYYRYLGSLTTPPCTEGVIWTINNQFATVSRSQVRLLRNAVHDFAENNARPLQPLNDRDILFYSPMYIDTLPTTSSVDVM